MNVLRKEKRAACFERRFCLSFFSPPTTTSFGSFPSNNLFLSCSRVMASVPTPHRTPLRRLSQGSLSRLSRSGAYPDAPHGLGFLEPALGELVDEAEALQVNVEGLKSLSNALATFNESFASWLYVMNMNALTTDWPQAPTDASYLLAKRRAGTSLHFKCDTRSLTV